MEHFGVVEIGRKQNLEVKVSGRKAIHNPFMRVEVIVVVSHT